MSKEADQEKRKEKEKIFSENTPNSETPRRTHANGFWGDTYAIEKSVDTLTPQEAPRRGEISVYTGGKFYIEVRGGKPKKLPISW